MNDKELRAARMMLVYGLFCAVVGGMIGWMMHASWIAR